MWRPGLTVKLVTILVCILLGFQDNAADVCCFIISWRSYYDFRLRWFSHYIPPVSE